MSELRTCPACGCRHLEVSEDSTIPTWLVSWTGDEVPLARFTGPSTLSPERRKRLAELRKKYSERVRLEESPEKPPEEREGFIPNRTECFIHQKDAQAEYNWIKDILIKRGDWEEQQDQLTLQEGERASWDELFGPNAIWIA